MEPDHVEDNMLAKLQRMHKFGKLKLPAFKNLNTLEDNKICVTVKPKKRTWYSLTVDVFIMFRYAVRARTLAKLQILYISIYSVY